MAPSAQRPDKLNESNLKRLSKSLSKQSLRSVKDFTSSSSSSPAASKASLANRKGACPVSPARSRNASSSSDTSSFWGPSLVRKTVSVESYSSHEDEVRMRFGDRVRRVKRPIVSSNFSFPSSPERSPPPSRGVGTPSQTAWFHSLGLNYGKGPVIVLLRHCESEGNYGATRNGVLITVDELVNTPDVTLSQRGIVQASELKRRYHELIGNVRRAGGKILMSHLLRAKQTGFFGFPELLDSHRDLVEIRPELQEIPAYRSDMGKAPQDQALEFPGFDYSRCTPESNAKTGIYAPKASPIRANAILKQLRKRPERILVLITHANFAQQLLLNDHWRDISQTVTTNLQNGEARVYAFEDHTTKLRPVLEKYATKILGKPT